MKYANSTSGTGRHISEYDKTYCYNSGSGKVIGEFVCDRVEKFVVGSLACDDVEKQACLSYKEICDYFYGDNYDNTVRVGYAWHIFALKIYDKPKELGAFFTRGECQREFCAGCKNFHMGKGWLDGSYCDEDGCIEWGIKPLTRPPQSWCYVEDLN